MNNPPLKLTHFRSTDIIHFWSVGFPDGGLLSDRVSTQNYLRSLGVMREVNRSVRVKLGRLDEKWKSFRQRSAIFGNPLWGQYNRAI